jgi:hypothetical protein
MIEKFFIDIYTIIFYRKNPLNLSLTTICKIPAGNPARSIIL